MQNLTCSLPTRFFAKHFKNSKVLNPFAKLKLQQKKSRKNFSVTHCTAFKYFKNFFVVFLFRWKSLSAKGFSTSSFYMFKCVYIRAYRSSGQVCGLRCPTWKLYFLVIFFLFIINFLCTSCKIFLNKIIDHYQRKNYREHIIINF